MVTPHSGETDSLEVIATGHKYVNYKYTPFLASCECRNGEHLGMSMNKAVVDSLIFKLSGHTHNLVASIIESSIYASILVKNEHSLTGSPFL